MDNAEWDIWFDNQYELNVRIHRAVTELAAEKDLTIRDAFRVALWTSVIEHAAEQLRDAL